MLLESSRPSLKKEKMPQGPQLMIFKRDFSKRRSLRGNKYGGAGRAFCWIGGNDSCLDYVDVNLGLLLFDLSKFIH
jgi:hypothetical protein